MFSRIRKRATYANVAMTLALVFAMSGGAYAAKKYLITSTKQISPSVLKALKGKAGPAGATGAQGPAGPAGPQGAPGVNGKDGAAGQDGKAGESVASAEVPTSNKAKCGGLGGAEYTVGGKTALICNGQTGFTNTLPAGKTEKGNWALSVGPTDPKFGAAFGVAGISFVIPLDTAPTVVYLRSPEVGVDHTTECPGSATTPEAESGFLCIYTETETEDNTFSPTVTGLAFGAKLIIFGLPGEFAEGTWAVTG